MESWSKKYTEAFVSQLDEQFKRVQDEKHWKNPINKILHASDEEIELIREAVIFYTGSVPHVERLQDGQVWVRASGYYMTVGA